MTSSTQPQIDELEDRALAGAIASCVESAAVLFDLDCSGSRRCLQRAAALVRASRRMSAVWGVGEPPQPGLAAWQVGRVMSYIDDNLSASIKARDLANQAHLSCGQFFRAFKASVGVPPFRYILNRRIELARKMMATTGEPLSRIAAACGLQHQSHLSKAFRRIVGESPNVWRRRNGIGPG